MTVRLAGPRRNETREVKRPIVAALNVLPGVRVFSHNAGFDRRTSVAYGLGVGVADIVGLVRACVVCQTAYPCASEAHPATGIFFALECKRFGQDQSHPEIVQNQQAWASMVRELGGFVAVVHSVDEAIAAVWRCRRGESE